jgi:hypothetical protein
MRREHLVSAILAVVSTACTTTNINAPQPNLQSINLGHPSCVLDCNTTQTATQSIGDGDVTGATVSNHRSRTTQPQGALQ